MTQAASNAPSKPPAADASVGLARRLGAILYDWIILVAILLLWNLSWVAFGILVEHPLYILCAIGSYLIAFAYFAWFWCHGGQTVGMAVWKIRLRGARRAIDWRIATTRFAMAAVSTLCLGAGFLWALFSPRRLTWHDHLSDSHLARV